MSEEWTPKHDRYFNLIKWIFEKYPLVEEAFEEYFTQNLPNECPEPIDRWSELD